MCFSFYTKFVNTMAHKFTATTKCFFWALCILNSKAIPNVFKLLYACLVRHYLLGKLLNLEGFGIEYWVKSAPASKHWSSSE